MQFGQHARFLRPRNEKLALAWDISSKCKLPTVKRTVGYESVSGARGRGEKTWMEKGGEELSMLDSPKHPRRPMHARFFPWATQKSRRVACTGEGFVAIVRPYDDRLIKKRFVAVNRGTRIYAALCTSYSSRITNSHMRRENLANTSVKTLPPLFLSFFFFIGDFAIGGGQNSDATLIPG